MCSISPKRRAKATCSARREVLAREDQHRALVEGGLDRPPVGGLERGEAHAVDHGAESRKTGLDATRHRRQFEHRAV